MKKFLITGALVFTVVGTLVFGNTIGAVLAADGSEKTFTIPPSELTNESQASTAAKGNIEYSKVIARDSSGKESTVIEKWYDPSTADVRDDTRINDSSIYNSTYMLKRCKEMIQIKRNEKGLPISGTITQYSDRVAESNCSLSANGIFNVEKLEYTKPEWKFVGTEKVGDKSVNKLSRSLILNPVVKKARTTLNADQAAGKAKTSLNVVEYVYIDQTTGLPVKLEAFNVTDGKMVLIRTQDYEFKNVENIDGSIFSTAGLELKEMPLVDFNPEEGVG